LGFFWLLHELSVLVPIQKKKDQVMKNIPWPQFTTQLLKIPQNYQVCRNLVHAMDFVDSWNFSLLFSICDRSQ